MLCINWACELIKNIVSTIVLYPVVTQKNSYIFEYLGTRDEILLIFGLDVSSIYCASQSGYRNA